MPTAPQTFGRRAQSAPRPMRTAPQPAPESVATPIPDFGAAQFPSPSLDEELREWKKARRFQIPWRPLSWMASLSFGIASLVLPDTVNDTVQWLLYGLTAASFCAGFLKRREAKKAAGR